jgi:hypothetical protein
MHCVGKEHKDISVWGDELILYCNQQIRSNRTVKCQIALSPFVKANRRCSAVAQFSLDGGKFSGSVRPMFRLDTSLVKAPQPVADLEKVIALLPSS